MSPGRGKEHACERNQNHIGRICSVVADHGDQRNDGREEEDRRAAYGRPHGAGEQTGTFSHTGTQHHDKYIAEWVEMRKRLGHFDPEPLYILSCQQADRADNAVTANAKAGLLVVWHAAQDLIIELRIDAEHGANDGYDHQRDDEIGKQENRIWQFIAGSFDPAENSFCLFLFNGFRHARISQSLEGLIRSRLDPQTWQS